MRVLCGPERTDTVRQWRRNSKFLVLLLLLLLLYSLFSYLVNNSITVIRKKKRMIWSKRVVHIGERRNVCLREKPE